MSRNLQRTRQYCRAVSAFLVGRTRGMRHTPQKKKKKKDVHVMFIGKGKRGRRRG